MKGIKILMASDVDQLIDAIELNQTSLFQKNTFVTQTAGINHYLKLKIAEKQGVISNHEFLSPNELIMELAHWMGNLNSAEFSTEHIRWRLFKLLDSDEFKKEFPNVYFYYQGEELKRIQLATKLADLFDQYVVFRTDMMIDWQSDPNFALDHLEERESWQKWLWLKLKQDIGDNYLDKAEYQRTIIAKLEAGEVPEKVIKRFPTIHIFGLTVLTKFHLELLWNLRHAIQVNFYFVNPCVSDFWYDCMSQKDIVKKWSWHRFGNYVDEYSAGNELLTSWGKVSQELFAQLFSIDDEVFSHLDYVEEEKEATTLLQAIQSDIHQNRRPEEKEIRFDAQLLEDKTIQLKSNFTEAREVEVLYDYLLNLIDTHYKGDLEPHDVVVMVPDVEKYVPFIKAVFDHAPKKLPYSIGDRPSDKEQSLLTVCLQILQVYNKEFTSESILQLFDYEIIKNRYSVKNIELIRKLVREANIRFGIKGDKDIETHLVSWELGLSKLFFSTFVKEGEFESDGERFKTLANVEGISTLEEVLHFVAFVRHLITHASILKQSKDLQAWNEYFVNLMNLLTSETDEQNEELEAICKKLDSLNAINTKLEGVQLSFETYLYILKSYHTNESIGDGYFRGRITFCQALPMRSIPFKVVAFLGLNAADFPRQDAEYAFDLIKMGRNDSETKKLGDRSTKDNDRYLFLEALLSAQDFFYMSYLGTSIKDSKALNPSILVDELLNYIEQYSEIESIKSILLEKHPLRSDSLEYLKTNGQNTYLAEKNKGDFVKLITSREEEKVSETHQLNDILSFYTDPIRYYYQKVLGVYYQEDDLLLPEEEKFELNPGLDQYAWKSLLLSQSLDTLNQTIREEKSKGNLPLGNVALLEIEKLLEKIQTAKEIRDTIVANNTEVNVDLDFKIGNHQIVGNVSAIYDNALLRINYSKTDKVDKAFFKSYVEWIFTNYQSNEFNISYLDINEGIKTMHNEAIAKEQLKKECEKLFYFYLNNKNKLVPFIPLISSIAFDNKGYKQLFDSEAKYNKYLKRSEELGIWEDQEQVKALAQNLMESYKVLFGNLNHDKK